jgi:hypothetical protein
MDSYVFLFSILATLALAGECKQFKQLRIVFYILCSALVFAFAAFRAAGVGADDLAYIRIFDSIRSDGFSFEYLAKSYTEYGVEPFFYIVNVLVGFVDDGYTYLFFGVAFISVGIAARRYFLLSPAPLLSLILFFSHTFLYRDINQIRAACAAAIALYVIEFVQRRDFLRFVIVVILCASFHVASVALLLLAILFLVNPSRLLAIFTVLVGMSASVVGAGRFIGYVPMPSVIAGKIRSYSENAQYSHSLGFLDITNIKNVVVFFVLAIFWSRLSKKVRYFDVMACIFAFGVAWRLIFADFSIIAGRVSTFFTITEVLLVSSLVVLFRQRIIPYFIVLIYAAGMLYLNLFVKDGRQEYASVLSLY